ncbi:unnamed protein product [Symbiodinium sp. CCMP2456]|nr:unnamed protein product [Symbiodinium sp. CCMP2456]
MRDSQETVCGRVGGGFIYRSNHEDGLRRKSERRCASSPGLRAASAAYAPRGRSSGEAFADGAWPDADSASHRLKEECRRLRQELTAQQQEERHLSGRVEQLEGCLRARTRQLDRLLQSVGGAEPMVPDQDRHADSFPRSQSAQLRVRLTGVRKESEQRLASRR